MVEKARRKAAAPRSGASNRGAGPAASGSPTPEPRTTQPEQFFQTEASWSDARGPLLCLSTGDWRTERPVFDREKCNACGFCYIFCPPQCIVDDEDGIHYTADLAYCKGCGVCARECPKGAITMAPEADYAEECHIG